MKRLAISLLILAILAAIVWRLSRSNFSDPKSQLEMHSHQLLGIGDAWLREPVGDMLSIQEFAQRWETAGVMVYTNRVIVDGIAYECLFSVRPQTVTEGGFLAVSTNRVVIWVADSRTPDIGVLRMSAFFVRTLPGWRSAAAAVTLERRFGSC